MAIAGILPFLFRIEVPGKSSGGTLVNDVPASIVPGINRALECYRSVSVKGTDLGGAEHECLVKVVEIGPLLALKLNAFGGLDPRRAGKDAYDILLSVMGYVDGLPMAIERFKQEKKTGNPAMKAALACLENDFSADMQDGPLRAAEFHPGTPEEKERVRQDMVTVGRALLEA